MKIFLYTKGYKYHKTSKTDMLFDVRILPNPHYEQTLKNKTGLDSDVYDYVINNPIAKEYLSKIVECIEYFANYRKNDVETFSVMIACTGGQHRSVAVAEYLKTILAHEVVVTHTDLKRVK